MMKELSSVKGIGEATAEKLHTLGIDTPEQLLFFLPSKYIDLKLPMRALDAEAGQFCLFEGKVQTVTEPKGRKAKSFVVTLSDCLDEKGRTFKAVFFNQPYYRTAFSQEKTYRFLGKLQEGETTVVNPVFEPVDKIKRLDGIMTVYPLRGLIGQATFSKLVANAFKMFREEYGEKGNTLSDALRKVHFPATLKEAEQGVAALATYDVATGIKIYRNTLKRGDSERKVFYNLSKNVILGFKNSLSITPTPTQCEAFESILGDLVSDKNMSRIVSGDVGSGKTVVAFFAAFAAAKAGYQCAVMAPTEILAEQHFRKFAPIAEKNDISAALLTASLSKHEHDEVANGLADGSVKVVFGTQALLSKKIEYKNLTLAVIDEQHKFGVNERAELQNRGAQDVLTLTATPIPRSLALAFYDDISVSRIEKRADAATNIQTRIVTDAKLPDMLGYIADECRKGIQAFIVCPSIKDCEGFETLSVDSFAKEYAHIFDGIPWQIVHGRMSGEEKESVMRDFAENKTKLLVATSVIEVGVDTKARIMCVLAADRFGLASLHQLRGRVGRTGEESYCFLHMKHCTEKAATRLKTVVECTDGNKVAERDFELRGAGDILGTRQSGSTSTPALGLPLTPDVLKAAKELPEDEKAFVTDFFEHRFAPELFRDFAEKIVRVTLDS